MPDFSAILVHVRDMRAEIARLNHRVSALRSTVSPSVDEVALSGRLHETIADYYNLAELRLLAADLGLNHEELNGEGVGDTALALVLWAGRHGRTAALMTILADQRPHVCWSDYR